MSVQATGMGAPSTAIVVEELVALGAKYIIRVGLSAEPNSKSSPPGTAGITARAVKPCDLIIAQGSNPNDGTTRHYLPRVKYAPLSDFDVLEALVGAARAAHHVPHVGLIQSDDGFYTMRPTDIATYAAMGVLAVEMETSILFVLGKLKGIKTGSILVASNYIGDAEFVAEDRLRAAVHKMVEVALEAGVRLLRGSSTTTSQEAERQ